MSEQRQSYPLRIEQVVKPTSDKQVTQTKSSGKPEGKRGRPKGSKNKDKTQINLSPELLRIKGMLEALLATIGETIPLKYLLLDGKFGHNNAAQMTRKLGLHLVSKLRYDSALYLSAQGTNSRRKYGDKLDARKLPQQFLVERATEGDWCIERYQIQALHKEFAPRSQHRHYPQNQP